MGKDFDIPTSISYQLPHFSCVNIFLDSEAQKDISRYSYCNQNKSIAPYPGTYGDQPIRWIHKSHIIEQSIKQRADKIRKKMEKENQNKVNTNG
tara:strand:- start:883 stop:1164 length:282 start_codon:yes stop_codon:yes gene_type:complete